MRVDIPNEQFFKALDVLRLAHIYALLGSEFENTLDDDFNPHKWQGYEKDFAESSVEAYLAVLAAAVEASKRSREWYEISEFHSGEVFARVSAYDGFDALSAYSEAEGFTFYVREDDPRADGPDKDGLAVAYEHEDGSWSGVFTNYSIRARKVDDEQQLRVVNYTALDEAVLKAIAGDWTPGRLMHLSTSTDFDGSEIDAICTVLNAVQR